MNIVLPDEIFERVSRLAANLGVEASAYVSALVADASSVEATLTLDEEAEDIELAKVDYPNGVTRGPRSDFSVKARWDMLDKGQPELIQEVNGAETMTRLMERMVDNFGQDILQKLSSLKVPRGVLVSRNPKRDFLNPSIDEPYAHHPIEGTDYFVLTHSSTAQKVAILRKMLHFLGLPEILLELQVHDKNGAA